MEYVIGDIHGCAKTLDALLNKLNLIEEDHIYFLGDYIDRGPRSKEVIDILMRLDNATFHLGNHEKMMLLALYDGDELDMRMWLGNGGTKTLESYGGTIDPIHLAFIREEFKLITELPNFYLCHAGIDPTNPMGCDENYYLEDRGSSAPLNNKKLIVGHTPMALEEIEEMVKNSNKIIIDNGCTYKDIVLWGNLIALRLDDMKLFKQENIDW